MTHFNRRTMIAGLTAGAGLVIFPGAANAQFGNLGLSSILGKATDSALDPPRTLPRGHCSCRPAIPGSGSVR